MAAKTDRRHFSSWSIALSAIGAFSRPIGEAMGKPNTIRKGIGFRTMWRISTRLLEQLSPERPATIVGHSLGGNASTVYAGLRPERVSRLVSLDGFGLPDRPAEEAPARLGRWLDSWRSPHSHKPYDNIAAMAGRLMKANERLSEDYALFLAEHMSRRLDDGMYVWAFDARLRAPFGWWNRRAEWAAYLGGVKAPVLFVGSGDVFPPAIAKEPDGLEGRVAFIPGAKYTRIDGTSHNLHHDAPQAVAALVEDFLADA